jgi:hypothetical protein
MSIEDNFLRDLITSSASTKEVNDSPTILSLQDSIDLMRRKFGDDWYSNIFARLTVIWHSSLFFRDHVKEVCENYPGLYELCEEYSNLETIQGKPLPRDFHSQILDFMLSFDPPKEEEYSNRVTFQTSPVRDAYFIVESRIDA